MLKEYVLGDMVSVLVGRNKGEQGAVRAVKDGMLWVRLYGYGNVMDVEFDARAVRKLTEAEITFSNSAVSGKEMQEAATGGANLQREFQAEARVTREVSSTGVPR